MPKCCGGLWPAWESVATLLAFRPGLGLASRGPERIPKFRKHTFLDFFTWMGGLVLLNKFRQPTQPSIFIINNHVLTSSGCHSFTALPLILPINSVGYAPSSLSASRSLSRSWSALSLVITQRSTHGQHTVNTRSTHGQHNGQHDTKMLKNI